MDTLEIILDADRIGVTTLNVWNSNLEVLPPEIGNLVNLTTLSVWNSNLETLPPEIGNLVNLTTLNVGNSNLETLPPEIGNLVNLTTLNVGNSNLEVLPPEIGNLVNLTTLNVGESNIEAFFYNGRHAAYFISDNMIKVGCELHSFTWWMDNYKRIANSEGFSENEVDAYLEWAKTENQK